MRPDRGVRVGRWYYCPLLAPLLKICFHEMRFGISIFYEHNQFPLTR